jgi:hypothetical protein
MRKLIWVPVANRSRLMGGRIPTMFPDQPDIDVGELADKIDISASIENTNPDGAVIAQEKWGGRFGICDAVLRQRPDALIIAVAPQRNYSVHHWASLEIHSHDVGASKDGLLGVLPTSATPRCGWS